MKKKYTVGTGYEQESPGYYIYDERGIIVFSMDSYSDLFIRKLNRRARPLISLPTKLKNIFKKKRRTKMEFDHTQEDIYLAIGLDKKERKRISRLLEDIEDDLKENKKARRSETIEAMANVAKDDMDVLLYLLAGLAKREAVKAVKVETIKGLNGLSELLDDILEGDLKSMDDCDCPGCTKRREEKKKAKENLEPEQPKESDEVAGTNKSETCS